MRTYATNFKSKLFKAAWTIFRKGGKTFSQSLKKAWRWAKSALVTRLYHVSWNKETEKAVLINAQLACIHTDQVARRNFWAPKSLITDGKLPSWFIAKKADELRSMESYSGASSLELELL